VHNKLDESSAGHDPKMVYGAFFILKRKEPNMHGIELFYYYRQDVMSGMYNGRRFFRKDPGSAMGAVLKDAMCQARRLVEGYRESCVCV